MEPEVVSGRGFTPYVPSKEISSRPLAHQKIEPYLGTGMYFVLLPMNVGAKALSYAATAADACTFRPVVSALGGISWVGGKLLNLVGRVTAVGGEVLQKERSRRVAREVGERYSTTAFQKAMEVRRDVGEAADHFFAYIPYVGGLATTAERGERAAAGVYSRASAGIAARTWRVAIAMMPFVGEVAKTAGKLVSWAGKKVSDLSYYYMMNPSTLNHIFQNFHDKMDSYAFALGEGMEPARPPILMCSDGDFRRFSKYGKAAKKKIFNAVVSSSWLRISEEEKELFAEALRKRGLKRTDEDRTALRNMYSAYLTMVGLGNERRALTVGDEQFQSFITMPLEQQDEQVFVVLSSPTWDLPFKDREKYETALKNVRGSQESNQPINEEDKRNVCQMIAMLHRLPRDYSARALTPQNFDRKLSVVDPIMARIRIMDIVRECSRDLEPSEKRKLATYRKVRSYEDWMMLDDATKKTLENIILLRFNRLTVHDQEKLYDVTPEQIWNLSEDLREEFFCKARGLFQQKGVEGFNTENQKTYLNDYSNVVEFSESITDSFTYKEKLQIHTLLTPPPMVVAFTKEQLQNEIKAVKDQLTKEGERDLEERANLSFYLKVLESTLESRELFVPMEVLVEEPPRQVALAQSVSPPVDIAKLREAVGKDVITSGVFYTSGAYIGAFEEWVGTKFGWLTDRLAQLIGFVYHPTVVQLLFSGIAISVSWFSSEERVLAALKILGLEERVRKLEEGAAKLLPHLVQLSVPLNNMLVRGITGVQEWATAASRAMRIVGDPKASAQELAEISGELRQAGEAVCAAARKLGSEGYQLSEGVSSATQTLVGMCNIGGARAIVSDIRGMMGHVSPTVEEAARTILNEVGTAPPPRPGLLAALNRWMPSWSFGPAANLVEVQRGRYDLANKLAILEKTADGARKIETLTKLFEWSAVLKGVVSNAAVQAGGRSFLSIIGPLMTCATGYMKAESFLVGSPEGKWAVDKHLKWLGFAREIERYSALGEDAVLNFAKSVAEEDKENIVSVPILKVIGMAGGAALSTYGFALTPIIVSFMASELISAIGEYLAPRARPMWYYLGAASAEASRAIAKGVGALATNVGFYLQRALNSGRYIDQKRIENFQNSLTQKDQEYIYHAVRECGKFSGQEKGEIDELWIKYRKHELTEVETQQLITRLLLGFEDLGVEDLLAINPFYYSMLAPYIQERLLDIVERYSPLTKKDKKSEDYLKILVEHFKELSPDQRAEIHRIPVYEYQKLSEEKQRELRFLIVHSQKYREKMVAAKARAQGIDQEVEKVTLSPSEILAEFEREPKGDELREFLAMYQQIDTKEISGVSPQQLISAGKAKILHALDIVRTYHARWIREIAERDGRDVEKLILLLGATGPLSGEEEAEKVGLVEALASLCRHLPDHQQKYLLDMTPQEVQEFLGDEEKAGRYLQHLVTCTEDPERRDKLVQIIGNRQQRELVPDEICEFFNALPDERKVEFREARALGIESIERIKKVIEDNRAEIVALTEGIEGQKDKLEGLVTAAECIKFKNQGKVASHADELMIQRFELHASATARKLVEYEGRLRDLQAVRSYYVSALERGGVRDIPPLRPEEVVLQTPGRKAVLLKTFEIADLELGTILRGVAKQQTLNKLETYIESQREEQVDRLDTAKTSIKAMDEEIATLQKDVTMGSDIAWAKAKAAICIIEKRKRCIQDFAEIFREKFSIVEAAVDARRVALTPKG